MCLALPGKVISIEHDESLSRMAKVDFGGVVKDISLDSVPEANMGDYVIVHAGFALNVLDEDEAQEVFQSFKELDEANKRS